MSETTQRWHVVVHGVDTPPIIVCGVPLVDCCAGEETVRAALLTNLRATRKAFELHAVSLDAVDAVIEMVDAGSVELAGFAVTLSRPANYGVRHTVELVSGDHRGCEDWPAYGYGRRVAHVLPASPPVFDTNS